MHEVTIPSVGMAMTEAVLSSWLKRPGDTVAAGDTLAEIETDKSTLDIESPADGILGHFLVETGATVPVGAVIVRVLQDGDTEQAGSDPTSTPAAVEPVAQPASADAAEPSAAPPTAAARTSAMPGERTPHTLSPRRRHQLRERAAAEGTSATPPAAPAQPAAMDRSAPHQAGLTTTGGKYRAAIAELVSESWRTIPHFAVNRDMQATHAQQALATLRAAGLRATVTDVLLRAFAVALRENGSPTGDLGLAVATADGVLLPVVAGIPALDPAALVTARTAAVARAKNGNLTTNDRTSRPIASLSNLGSLGVDSFTGVIPLGQQLLLTVGRITQRPVFADGRVTGLPSFMATLNVDHRAFDGADAARILGLLQVALNQSPTWARGVVDG